jgi:hypothetical protein
MYPLSTRFNILGRAVNTKPTYVALITRCSVDRIFDLPYLASKDNTAGLRQPSCGFGVHVRETLSGNRSQRY